MTNKFDILGNLRTQAIENPEMQKQFEDLTVQTDRKPEDGEAGEFTVAAIWRTLSVKGDVILIIDRIDEPRIRKQLSGMKAKENYKLKSAGLQPDNATLEFIEHNQPDLPADQIKIQIILKNKPTIKLHKFIVPKD